MRGIEFVRLEFVDLLGNLKGFEVPKEKYSQDRYLTLDGSSIPGFTTIESSDLYLKPAQSTFREDTDTAFVFCDLFTPAKKRFEGDTRHLLEKAIDATDLEFMAGAEPEFYLLNEKKPHDGGCYFDTSKPFHNAVKTKREIVRRLKKAGLDIELKHHEVGPGQYEIIFRAESASKTAENILLFKRIVRETAYELGSVACFLPKPFHGFAGNGMHVHLSAWEDGKNAFYDGKGLSRLAQQFTAGLLAHAREITAVTNPTINSYKRLVPGFEVPVNICWGFRNRSTLIRIPASEGGRTRIEYRSPDPSANPFLALAVIIAAGMDGVDRGLSPPEAVKENVYENPNGLETLPSDLREALDAMEKSRLVRKTLGTHVFKEFLKLKRGEWRDYCAHVTDWEREKYLTV